MTASAVADRDFTGLTITDARGGSLVIERTTDGRTVAWIAPPGTNDGPGVTIADDDRQQLAAFLGANKPGHEHTCAEVDHLKDEVRDLKRALTVYANEHMRMAAVHIAACALTAVFKLDGRDPNVDVDLAMEQGCRRLAEAVADAEGLRLHPDTLAKHLRVAIDDPGMVLERYRGRAVDEPPYESMTEWQTRAVLHVLTHPIAEAVS
ncbi:MULTISPECIES: hypothetical protein [unclassified Micromonospora]|uniref:hypothetical protein n=1 Tax=unclassified Micromonospora TaxID=2617518 RepID=UPI0033241EA9